MMRRIVLGVVVLATIAAIACAAPPAAQNSEPEEVHVHVVRTAHSSGTAAETLSGIEQKFAHSHDKFVRRLNSVLRKVTDHVGQHKSVEFMEVGGVVLPKIDGTGSIPQGAPKANLTRFTVKPAIDAALVLDAKLTKAPKATALLEAEGVVLPVLDNTGSHAHTPKVNLTRFSVKPVIDAALVVDQKLVKQAAKAASFIEAEGVVLPVLDNTGSHAHTPKANLTRFAVKPVIDASLTLDAKLAPKATALLEVEGDSDSDSDADAEVDVDAEVEAAIDDTAESEATVDVDSEVEAAIESTADAESEESFVEVSAERMIYPILDNTGADSFTPKANLTRFKVKPAIDASLVLDATLVLPAAPVASAPTTTRSLLEDSSLLEQGDCPGCKNAGRKQDYEVIVSPQANPNDLDAPLFAEQHRKIDYLLNPVKKTLSIREADLQAARNSVVDADEAHQRFHDFKEKHENMPLLPQE